MHQTYNLSAYICIFQKLDFLAWHKPQLSCVLEFCTSPPPPADFYLYMISLEMRKKIGHWTLDIGHWTLDIGHLVGQLFYLLRCIAIISCILVPTQILS